MAKAKYDGLQTTALNIDWEKVRNAVFFQFSLNQKVCEKINGNFEQLCVSKGEELNKRSIPVKKLELLIMAKHPNVFYFPSTPKRLSKSAWFYSSKPLDVNLIKDYILTWAIIEKLDTNIDWDEEEIGFFSEVSISPDSNEKFVLLPSLMAKLISEHVIHIDSWAIKEKQEPTIDLKFHRITSTANSPIELVSMPPIKQSRSNDYYSYLIQIKLHTVPQRKDPVIHFSLGLRRWANTDTERIYFKKKNKINVNFILREKLTSAPPFLSFSTAQLFYDWSEQEWRWNNNPIELFSKYNLQGFPDFEISRKLSGLLKEEGKNPWITGLLHSTQMKASHRAKIGTGPFEKAKLFDALEPILRPHGFIRTPIRVDFLPLTTISNVTRLTDPSHETSYLNFAKSLSHKISSGFMKPLKIHIFPDHADSIWVGLLKQEFSSIFGEDFISTNLIFQAPNELLFRSFSEEEISSDFSQAKKIREIEIEKLKFEKDYTHLVFYALEEIKGKKDPRGVIRKALLSKVNGVKQFTPSLLNDKSKDVQEKIVKNTVLAGLLELGIIHPSLKFRYSVSSLSQQALIRFREKQNDDLDKSMTYHNKTWIGIYLMKSPRSNQKGYFLIAVKILLDGRVFYALKDMTQFKPFHENIQIDKQSQSEKEIVDSLFILLRGIQEYPQERFVVLIHAQNNGFRNIFPFLTDSFNEKDLIPNQYKKSKILFDQKFAYTPQELPNVDIIRLRTSDDLQTPEGFAFSEDLQEIGLHQGLYESQSIEEQDNVSDPLRTFYSVTERAETQQANRAHSQMGGKSVNFWNPNLVEIFHQFKSPGSDIIETVTLVHFMRRLSSHVKGSTRYPLPLFLASVLKKRIQDYIG